MTIANIIESLLFLRLILWIMLLITGKRSVKTLRKKNWIELKLSASKVKQPIARQAKALLIQLIYLYISPKVPEFVIIYWEKRGMIYN